VYDAGEERICSDLGMICSGLAVGGGNLALDLDGLGDLPLAYVRVWVRIAVATRRCAALMRKDMQPIIRSLQFM
jgi:hypothetical protein